MSLYQIYKRGCSFSLLNPPLAGLKLFGTRRIIGDGVNDFLKLSTKRSLVPAERLVVEV